MLGTWGRDLWAGGSHRRILNSGVMCPEVCYRKVPRQPEWSMRWRRLASGPRSPEGDELCRDRDRGGAGVVQRGTARGHPGGQDPQRVGTGRAEALTPLSSFCVWIHCSDRAIFHSVAGKSGQGKEAEVGGGASPSQSLRNQSSEAGRRLESSSAAGTISSRSALLTSLGSPAPQAPAFPPTPGREQPTERPGPNTSELF